MKNEEIPLTSVLLIIFSIFMPRYMVAQKITDPLSALIETVARKDTVNQHIDPGILSIVNDFYADTLVSTSKTVSILSFITDAYGEHGYSESGSWVKNSPGIYYYPSEYELPDYTMSDFTMPAQGKLTSLYGYRPERGRFHQGIDIALNLGDTVKGVLPGIVAKTGYDNGGYGHYVVLSHSGGVETIYGHLLMPMVKPGERIKQGEPIGLGGSTGNSTGPHLHLETRYRGVALDPISWFGLEKLLR